MIVNETTKPPCLWYMNAIMCNFICIHFSLLTHIHCQDCMSDRNGYTIRVL